MSIMSELSKLTKVKRKSGESDQDFYARQVAAAEKLPDATFDDMTEATQAWCNDAVKAVKKKKPIAAPADETPEPETTEAEPVKAGKGKGKEKPAETEPETTEAEPVKAGKGKGKEKPASTGKQRTGACTEIANLFAKNLKKTKAQLIELCRAKGIESSDGTIVATYSHGWTIIKALQGAGIVDKSIQQPAK